MTNAPSSTTDSTAADTAYDAGNWVEARARLLAEQTPARTSLRRQRLAVIDLVQQSQAALESGDLAVAEERMAEALALDPDFHRLHNALGNICLNTDRLADAERHYRRAVALRPDYAAAYCNLAGVKMAEGRVEEALPPLDAAIRFNPDFTYARQMRCEALRMLGRHADCESDLRALARLEPDDPVHWPALGGLLFAQGRAEEALYCFEQAERLLPENADILNNQGCALHALGRFTEAMDRFHRAIAFNPEDADAPANLGLALTALDRLPEALDAFASAESHTPGRSDIFPAYSLVLRRLERWQALADYGRQVSLRDPGFVDALAAEAEALVRLNRLDEAERLYRRAISLQPEEGLHAYNLGCVLLERHRYGEATDCFEQALKTRPDYAPSLCNLGNCLLETGEFITAARYFNRAAALDPDQFSLQSNRLFSLCFDPSVSSDAYLMEARKAGKHMQKAALPLMRSDFEKRPLSGPLRVGMVSGDLLNHPVGYFLESLLRHIDPQRLELIAYPTRNASDDLTNRIRPHFRAWRPLDSLDYQQATEVIRRDGIDILIDLAGHTAFNLLPVFAGRAAPVQVSWLGFFASTGIPTMDWLLSDPVSTPPGVEGQFSEKLWRLPHTRLCFSPPATALPFPVNPSPCLNNGHITFGCFQRIAKINDSVIRVWCGILEKLPHSRLMLKGNGMFSPGDRLRLAERFAQHGVAPERIVVTAPESREQYFRAYHDVDIMLDTFPFPGGTTTCEALWMGVPTVTLAGDRLLSRQGASLLAAVPLTDWIARTEEDFVKIALGKATRPQELAALRASLREMAAASPLMDARLFASDLESALYGMWQSWLEHSV